MNAFIGLLSLIVTVSFVTWTASTFYYRMCSVEKAVDTLKKSVDARFTALETSVASLEKSVKELRMGLSAR